MTAPVLSVPALQIRLDPQGASTPGVIALLLSTAVSISSAARNPGGRRWRIMLGWTYP
jgi:hypothetical protein